MTEKINELTQEGKELLERELEELSEDKIRTLAELKEAKEQGDLSENAGYDEARKRLGFLEGRILEISGILENSKVISHRKSNKIRLGSKVKVKTEEGKIVEYTIVTSPEADPLNLKVSDESPIGQALLSHAPGQKISYQTPKGSHKLEIISFQ